MFTQKHILSRFFNFLIKIIKKEFLRVAQSADFAIIIKINK